MREDYEFKIILDWYNEIIKEEGTEIILIKKDAIRKWYVSDIYTITDLREKLKANGKPYTARCEVFSKTEGKWLTVKGSYNSILNILKPFERKKIKGYNGV